MRLRRARRLAAGVACLGSAATAWACSALLGFNPGTLASDGGADDAGEDVRGEAGDGSSAPADASIPDTSNAPPPDSGQDGGVPGCAPSRGAPGQPCCPGSVCNNGGCCAMGSCVAQGAACPTGGVCVATGSCQGGNDEDSPPPPPFPDGGAVTIAAGGDDTCVIVANGAVECWGDNSSGQLGNGNTNAVVGPVVNVKLPPASGSTLIAVGGDHACAAKANSAGPPLCWGNNDYGQLGNGSTTSSPYGDPVSLTTPVFAMGAGDQHTCVEAQGGEIFCWGNDVSGDTGSGSGSIPKPNPLSTTLPTSGAPPAIIAGGEQHTCILVPGQGVYCFGSNSDGQLGIGLTTTSSSTAVRCPGVPSTVTSLATGAYHSCAAIPSAPSGAFCWGRNDTGQLGSSPDASTPVPQPVPLPGVVNVLAAGAGFTCALMSGSVACWGDNTLGQCGGGSPQGTGINQIQLPGAAKGLAAGANHACAILVDGSVYCWGSNSSQQLGVAATQTACPSSATPCSPAPIQVSL